MELLAPAGSLEKLKYAVLYGADSVYAAGKEFGLRAKASNLSNEEMVTAVEFCHSKNKHIYVPINIYAHNKDFEALPAYIRFLNEIGVDAVIVSDPGVLLTVKETAPEMAIHLSTQANTTSYQSVRFWKEQGVERIILARELTFAEITEIKRMVPDMEIEMFIHGAMCISYSGRCLISAFLNERSANQGLCTHPCRWKFHLYEESRPGQYFPIEEDDRGSYILNSKDLCLYEKLPLIMAAGIDAIKIEGRMKSLYYVANTTRVYRSAIDKIQEHQRSGEINAAAMDTCPEYFGRLREELEKVSHREWTQGFFDGRGNDSQCYKSSSYIRDYQFLGEVVSIERVVDNNPESGLDSSPKWLLSINVRAKFQVGDTIEYVFPDIEYDEAISVEAIYDENNNLIPETKPNTIVRLISSKEYPLHGILRKADNMGQQP